MADTKRTALFDVHKRLKARLIPFGGWDMPVEYSGIAREHAAVRTTAGLFDVSHMGEVDVLGPQALDLVQSITTNDASKLEDGQAQYSALSTVQGTPVDDLLVYRHNGQHFLLVVNAGNTAKDLAWVKSHNFFKASVEDNSADTTLLSLQGPVAIDILQRLTPVPLSRVQYYHFTSGKVLQADAIISRTGYTGEDGFELYFDNEYAEQIWNALMEAGTPLGLLPTGLGARNTLRLEAKMLLYGNDMDETTPLFEAGLGWIVKFDKGAFVGRDALMKQKAAGPKHKLVGFEMLGREIAREHYPVFINGSEAGHVSSGSPSITLKKNIGLAYLPAEHAAIGTAFEVGVRGRMCGAVVVPTPFYKRR